METLDIIDNEHSYGCDNDEREESDHLSLSKTSLH